MAIERSKMLVWCARLALCTPQGNRNWISGARVALASAISILLLGATALTVPDPLLAQAATRPNIVVIMTDDLRLDEIRVLPKTRALIGAGTTFRNNFVTFPYCCPSRATFLTGQYPHNHGVFDTVPPNGGYIKLDHTNTLALWLQEAGYSPAISANI